MPTMTAGMAMISKMRASKMRFMSSPLFGGAAASQRQFDGCSRGRYCAFRYGLSGEPAAGCVDIFQCQFLRDLRHAVGRFRFAYAVSPRAELRVDIVARQTDQARNGRRYAGQHLSMTGDASRHFLAAVAVHDQIAAAFQYCRRSVARLWCGVGRMLLREVVGELVEQIALRLTGDAGIKPVAGGTSFFAMARGTGNDTLGNRIRQGLPGRG